MDVSSLYLTSSFAAFTATGTVVAGWFVWWLIRKRHNRIWLPTVRVLEIESRLLPKLQLQPPPLIPFFCFLAASLALAWFAFAPTKRLFRSFEPNEARYHILLDVSPSMAGQINMEQYAQRFADLWGTLSKTGRVSVSSTQSPEFNTPKSLGEANAYFEQLAFHRAGVKLGHALKGQVEELGKTDRLFIVSDGNQHSWADLNWRFLSTDLDVLWVDLSASKGQNGNIFINRAEFVSAPGAESVDWDVELVRTRSEAADQGVVAVQLGSARLASIDYSFPAGRSSQIVRVSWAAGSQETTEQERHLLFRVTPAQKDDLPLDNLFRTQIKGRKQNGLIVAGPAGEMLLEDPTHHLQKSLQVLDFRLKRLDRLRQPGPDATAYPFWVLVGGTGNGVDHFCPVNIETARLARRKQQGAKSAKSESLPSVWLIPQNPKADYREMCWCYARLMVSQSPMNQRPVYCEDVVNRNRYIGVLSSLGAQQIGGDLDDVSGALAFKGFDAATGLQLVAFTIPLTPLRATGVSHAALPILVKNLLELQGLLATNRGRAKEAWPRIADLSQVRKKRSDPSFWRKVLLSNVPAGESVLQQVSRADMPPRWLATAEAAAKQLPNKKDQNDPLPWIRLCAMVIVGALILEVLYLAAVATRRLMTTTSMLIGAVMIGGGFDIAQAQVEVNLLDYGSYNNSLGSLKEEVALRTSIDMNSKPERFNEFNEVLAGRAWFWVQNLSKIVTSEGELKPGVIDWIKRGGFLVVEGNQPTERLVKMTERPFEYGPLKPRWQPIPPDHELMRSFHLLDSLPVCDEWVWRGFHFDGRLAILAIPFRFLENLMDRSVSVPCVAKTERERSVRVFINLLMVVLATDYKKDQIHLPEILKRLR